MALKQLRNEIDRLDRQIIELLNQRMELSTQTQSLKVGVKDPQREAGVIQNVRQAAAGRLDADFVEGLYRTIIDESRRIQSIGTRKSDEVVIGLQSGPGSYNEQAALHYLARGGIKNYQLKYFHNTRSVLKALHSGQIDLGQFAIYNSSGGIVWESLRACAEYNFKILDDYAIQISHNLMIRRDAEMWQVKQILCHPQVLKQCERNLRLKYPRLRLGSGEGELIGHARVAELLGRRELPKQVATIGAKELAELHGLNIIEENLQDRSDNQTSFVLVCRPLTSGTNPTSRVAANHPAPPPKADPRRLNTNR